MRDITCNGLYKPIHSKSTFRVLKEYGAKQFEAPIECCLLETLIDDGDLLYEAISYSWADQLPTQPIQCGCGVTNVTKNCEAALRRFRPTCPYEYRLLWIDSLCINQQDIHERSQQVGIMGSIYAKAEQVLIWLGNGTEPIKGVAPNETQSHVDAFDWMVRVADAAEEQALEGGTQRLAHTVEELKNLDLMKFIDSVSWFKRSWIIQEVALSKKAILFYGRLTTTLDKLMRADSAIQELRVSGIFGAEDAISNPLWSVLAVHGKAKELLTSFDGYTPNDEIINSFLSEMRFSQASEAKDKAFSLRGLLAAAGVPTPPPDYSMSTAEIYRQTAVAVIRSTKGLMILEQIDGIGATPQLASWVPDWASAKHSIGLLGRSHASLPTVTPYLDFRDNARQLIVKGSTVDTIVARCELSIAHKNERLGDPKYYFVWSRNCQPNESPWRNALEDNPQHSMTLIPLWNFRVLREFVKFALGPDVALASEESVLALYHTLMSHCDNHDDAIRDQAQARLWFSILSGQQQGLGNNAADTSQTSPIIQAIHNILSLTDLRKTSEYRVCQQTFQSSICRIFQDRIGRIRYKTIFRTASGKLGIAPYSIRAGDKIALLEGVRVPMVNRPFETAYRLVGQAYVQGIGGGETWLQPGSVPREMTLV